MKVVHPGNYNFKYVSSMVGKVAEAVSEECDVGVPVQHDLVVTKQCIKAVNSANSFGHDV